MTQGVGQAGAHPGREALGQTSRQAKYRVYKCFQTKMPSGQNDKVVTR